MRHGESGWLMADSDGIVAKKPADWQAFDFG
jgi:hypothetical protein